MTNEANSTSEDDVLANKASSHDDIGNDESSTRSWFIGRNCALVALLIVVVGISVGIGYKWCDKQLESCNTKLQTGLVSEQKYGEKLGRWIRGEEKYCFKTFVYHFDEVIIHDEEQYKTLFKKYNYNIADLIENTKGVIDKLLFGDSERLNMLETHFLKMRETKANLLIFSIFSPKEVIESLFHYLPDSMKLEIWDENRVSDMNGKMTDILLSLLRTTDLEWYEVKFIYKTELEYVSTNNYRIGDSLSESLAEIENMARNTC